MNKPILEFLKSIAEDMEGEGDNKKDLPPPAAEEQEKILREFLAQKPLQVGDVVVRNEHGKTRYNYPEEHITIVSLIFDKPMLEDKGEVATGEVILVRNIKGRLVVVPHSVDLRFYEKAPTPTAH